MTTKALEREALKLNERQRAALANRLFDSLEPRSADIDESRLLDVPRSKKFVDAELQRRIEEAERDPSVMIPAEVVFARLRKQLRDEARKTASSRRKGTR